MFYFSRAEQVALVLLLALLLTGAGLLIYSRGERAGQGGADLPLLVETPSTPQAGAHAAEASVPGALGDQSAGGTPEAESASPQPASQTSAKPGAASPRKEGFKPSSSSPIHLNSATAREMEALPGIGPVLAQRIVQYREQLTRERGHGFESVDELLNVPGIGPKRLAAVRDLVAL